MSRLSTAFALAFAQLGDRAILKVLGKTALISLAIFAVAGAALWWALDAAIETWIVANLPADYSDTVAGIVAASIALVGAWLLFRIVALAVLQFFADEVVLAVEARHYPQAAASARQLPFREDLRNAISGTARAVIANLVALPFALVLLITGVGTALLFWAVNAWLLGRELEQMAWLRHRHERGARSPLGGATRFMLGGIVAAMLVVPFANLLAPVLGAAAATHLVHRRRVADNAA